MTVCTPQNSLTCRVYTAIPAKVNVELTDDTGLAIKRYPCNRSDEDHNPRRIVVIPPRIAFGRLAINGTGIPTSIITEHYKAGDIARPGQRLRLRPQFRSKQSFGVTSL